jgi:hypothetical protein
LTGWLAIVLAILVTVALIVGDIASAGHPSWWGSHSLTTDTVSGTRRGRFQQFTPVWAEVGLA